MADIFQIVENNGTPKDIGDSKARANIAPTFNVNNANEVGDLVLSDTGILYRFNAAYTAGTSWNSRTSKEQVNLANELSNAVKKSGDTMSGLLSVPNIDMQNNDMDTTASSIPATVGTDILVKDSSNKIAGFFEVAQYASGTIHSAIAARRSINNANFDNSIILTVKPDGTRDISVSDKAVWRNGLSAAQRSDLGIVEDTNNATHTIAAGQYVIWKGNLYTANTAIANGAALSTSNLTQVTNGGLNDVVKYEVSSNGFTPDATNVSWTWGGTHLYISGKMRILVVSVTVNGSSTEYYTIGRVPSGHFPSIDQRAVCVEMGGSHSRIISIDTAGYVKIFRPEANYNYWAEIVYMVP